MIGYKVVRMIFGRRGQRKLVSGWLSINNAIPVVEYQVGKWSKPKRRGGPLGVFNNFESALSFKYRIDNVSGLHHSFGSVARIYRCEYELSPESAFWYRGPYKCASAPHGTVFAERVKLISDMTEYRTCVVKAIDCEDLVTGLSDRVTFKLLRGNKVMDVNESEIVFPMYTNKIVEGSSIMVLLTDEVRCKPMYESWAFSKPFA